MMYEEQAIRELIIRQEEQATREHIIMLQWGHEVGNSLLRCRKNRQ